MTKWKMLQKPFGCNFRHLLFIYVIASLAYAGVRLYSTLSVQHTKAERRIIGPIQAQLQSQEKYIFVTETIEDSRVDDLEKNILYNQATVPYRKEREFGLDKINDAFGEESFDFVLQSKMFSNSMDSTNVIPFYSKAKKAFKVEDITISTIVTSDRFPILSRLATEYKGPISAAIHINDNKNKRNVIEKLHETLLENSDVSRYVDIHLIIDKYDRQFNRWRNVAKLYTRTDYVMMLDIDFYLCTNFRKDILANKHGVLDLLRDGRTALVVPAFEYNNHLDGMDYTHFPNNKHDLMQEVFELKNIDMFHRSWRKGHASTDYLKWYSTDKPYRVENYDFAYEPYVIFKRQGSPWCDERFIGYGANKAACLYEIYLSGVNYVVLPDDFIIHQSHGYPESTRKRERVFNRKAYANFREELCLRYSRQFIENGKWNTSTSDNLKNVCQKIHGLINTIGGIDQ